MRMYDIPDLQQVGEQGKARLERIQELHEKLTSLTGAGENADGTVRVVVAQGSALKELTLNPRVMRLPSEILAEQIIEAATVASADLERQVNEAVTEAIGESGLGIDMKNPVESAQKQFDQIQRGLETSLDEIMANVERLGRRLQGGGRGNDLPPEERR
jgi:DNA-binding protein YbaB